MIIAVVSARSGENGFCRLVRRTSRFATTSVASLTSVGMTTFACGADPSCAARTLHVRRGPFMCGADPSCAARTLRVRVPDRLELRRPLAVPHSALERHIRQLVSRRDTTKHEPTAAHVAAADEIRW